MVELVTAMVQPADPEAEAKQTVLVVLVVKFVPDTKIILGSAPLVGVTLVMVGVVEVGETKFVDGGTGFSIGGFCAITLLEASGEALVMTCSPHRFNTTLVEAPTYPFPLESPFGVKISEAWAF